MPEHNRLAGNCVHQSARATDDQVCRVPDCLDANPIEPSGISGKLTATSDVVQRARQALDGIETPTPWVAKWGGVYGTSGTKSTYYGKDGSPSVAVAEGGYVEGEFAEGDAEFIAAAPDLVRELLALVEVALPTITAQRDDAVAEVASIRDELAKALPDTTIRHKGDTARAVAHLTAERDTARILAQRLEDNSAALDRARTFIDKQVAVSEAHLDNDDHNLATIAYATLSLLRRIDQALDGKTTS